MWGMDDNVVWYFGLVQGEFWGRVRYEERGLGGPEGGPPPTCQGGLDRPQGVPETGC